VASLTDPPSGTESELSTIKTTSINAPVTSAAHPELQLWHEASCAPLQLAVENASTDVQSVHGIHCGLAPVVVKFPSPHAVHYKPNSQTIRWGGSM
jgi:hypothetical protein